MVTITKVKEEEIELLSKLATKIVREHFDPIIGPKQNDYMLALYQSVEGIQKQFEEGYRYYFVHEDDALAGFLAFFPKENYMYLSKFYIDTPFRGHHLARSMVDLVVEETKKEGLTHIQLNCNKNNDNTINKYYHLGFELLRYECNDIGNGFFMDDVVLIKKV